MRPPNLVLLLGVCGVLVMASAAHSDPPTADPLARRLWDAEPRELAAALVPWWCKPVFDVRTDVPELRWTASGQPEFAKPTWADSQQVVYDEGGFRTILELSPLADDGGAWAHDDPSNGFVFRAHGTAGVDWGTELACYKQKGDTNFEVRRIFDVTRPAPQPPLRFVARFQVFDAPAERKSVGDLLLLLRRRFGTFDALCARLADHVAAERKPR